MSTHFTVFWGVTSRILFDILEECTASIFRIRVSETDQEGQGHRDEWKDTVAPDAGVNHITVSWTQIVINHITASDPDTGINHITVSQTWHGYQPR